LLKQGLVVAALFTKELSPFLALELAGSVEEVSDTSPK
jgi:hypothetical protein